MVFFIQVFVKDALKYLILTAKDKVWFFFSKGRWASDTTSFFAELAISFLLFFKVFDLLALFFQTLFLIYKEKVFDSRKRDLFQILKA